jgi:AraC-like DNA-binding protein
MADEAKRLLGISGHSVPGSQALAFIDVLKPFRIPATELLEPFGLTEMQLEEPGTRIPVEVMNAIVVRGRARSGEPGIGVYMGLHRRLSNYGFLGMAATHASTLRDALDLMVEFAPTVSTAMGVRLEVQDSKVSIRLIENIELGDVRDVVLLSMVIGLMQMGPCLTGREMTGKAYIALPKPSYYDRFANLLCEFEFGAPDTRLVFDASHLDWPVVAADRAALRLARQQCERALAELHDGRNFVHCVRRLIPRPGGFSTLEEVSDRVHMSPRTLRRRLANHGVNFADLIDEERRKEALLLLKASDRSLSWIGEQLGYATLPNFVRAFKRWTGQTPAAYRRTVRGNRPVVAAAPSGSLPQARPAPTLSSMKFTERI